jgi:uncharacterized protein (TIGR02145 family)
MKTIRFTIFSILLGLLVLVSACKKETNPEVVTQSGSKILVTGQDAGIGLKSTLSGLSTVWVATSDKVGIYSTQARTASGGAGTEIVNAPFVAVSSAASSTFSGTMYWGAGMTSHTFYAYYPWVTGTAASSAVPVSLATAQTQSAANNSAHIGALDFMVATPKTVTSLDNTDAVGNAVNLRYNHLFTVLEFQIKGAGELKAVKLTAPTNPIAHAYGSTVNITQTTPETGTTYQLDGEQDPKYQVVVTLTTPATLNASTATTVYMVINPGTQTGNCTIGLSSDGTSWTDISKAAPTGGFLRGKKYVVTIEKDQYGNFFSTVTNPTTGKTWMDRNLGASQVATSSTDALAYGDLYQWGRLTDGHQLRTSATTSTQASTDVPGNANFIMSVAPCDWRSPPNTNLWQGVNGVNNPCPSGYRVPTDTELNAESSSWGSQNAAGAFASPLKLPVTGFRSGLDGSFQYVGDRGYYWSSTVNGISSNYLVIDTGFISINPNTRGYGFSVRCIKD